MGVSRVHVKREIMSRFTAILLFSCALSYAVAKKQPNIVFVICDSMDGRVVDPTSSVSRTVKTPNFDSLAASGVNFVNNYCPSPQCVPSRSAMFSGRYVHRMKTWSNAQGLCVKWNKTDPAHCDDQGNNSYWQTFDYQFEKAGYDVQLFGKVDVGGGIGGGFHGTSGSTYAGLTAWTRAANITHPQKQDPRTLVNDNASSPFSGDASTIERCVKYLQDNANNSKPFFLYCGINIPHPAYHTNKTWLAMVNESAVTMPTWIPYEKMHPADQFEASSKALHYDGMKPFTKDDILSVRRTYYAMCAETDYFLGEVVKALESVGKRDDTYIIFTSDHGEGNMEHMQTWKNSMYDANNKVPLIVSGPGVTKGNVVANATSNLDLYPTMLDWAGLDVPSGLQLDGHSLSSFLVPGSSRQTTSRPDFVFGEYHSNMANTGHFMIKRGNYKYIAFGQTPPYENFKPQLFNLATDPEEIDDIAESAPDIAAEMAKLMSSVADIQAIDKECKDQDKVRFNMWFEQHKSTWVKELGKAAYYGPGTEPFGSEEDLKKMATWINGTKYE